MEAKQCEGEKELLLYLNNLIWKVFVDCKKLSGKIFEAPSKEKTLDRLLQKSEKSKDFIRQEMQPLEMAADLSLLCLMHPKHRLLWMFVPFCQICAFILVSPNLHRMHYWGIEKEEKSTAPQLELNPWPQEFCSAGVCSTTVLQPLPLVHTCTWTIRTSIISRNFLSSENLF